MARPRLEIDPKQVEKLAKIGCSYAEIAAVMNCSADTLERRFAVAIKDGHEHRNSSLRRKQYQIAMTGHPTMLIWLGKQFLGQSDKNEIDHSGSIDLGLAGRMGAALERVQKAK